MSNNRMAKDLISNISDLSESVTDGAVGDKLNLFNYNFTTPVTETTQTIGAFRTKLAYYTLTLNTSGGPVLALANIRCVSGGGVFAFGMSVDDGANYELGVIDSTNANDSDKKAGECTIFNVFTGLEPGEHVFSCFGYVTAGTGIIVGGAREKLFLLELNTR